MRTILLIASTTIGGLVSVLITSSDDLMTRAVMACIGLVCGAAIGGAVFGRPRGTRHRLWFQDSASNHVLGRAAANYWRDRGHAPFTKPWDALPDRHMLDPDKVE